MKSNKVKIYFTIAIIISLAIGLLINLNAILDNISSLDRIKVNCNVIGYKRLITNISITVLVSFCTFLLNFYIVKPLNHLRKTSMKRVFFALFLTLVSVYILSDLFHAMVHMMINRNVQIRFNIIYTIRDVIIALIVFAGIFVIKTVYDRQSFLIENERLTSENLLSQYESLKNQISPHFLFNSLSALKVLINEDVSKAQLYVDNLSEVLRYSIQNHEQKTVTIRDELQVLSSYIFLVGIRYETNLSIDLEVDPSYGERRIPQLAVQTLVENAVKHNVISNRHPLSIKIYIENDKIIVWNNLKEKISPEEGTGIGLPNLANQYRLLSGGEISIIRTNDSFKVELPLLKPINHDSSNS